MQQTVPYLSERKLLFDHKRQNNKTKKNRDLKGKKEGRTMNDVPHGLDRLSYISNELIQSSNGLINATTAVTATSNTGNDKGRLTTECGKLSDNDCPLHKKFKPNETLTDCSSERNHRQQEKHQEQEQQEGQLNIEVQSIKDISKGTQILSCQPIGLALEPSFRRTHCGFCVYPIITASIKENNQNQKKENESFNDKLTTTTTTATTINNSSSNYICKECKMIAICTNCQKQQQQQHQDKHCHMWHTMVECSTLKAVRDMLLNESGIDDNDIDDDNIDDHHYHYLLDSCHFLTIRIYCHHIFQRRQEQQSDVSHGRKVSLSTSQKNATNDLATATATQSSSLSSLPLDYLYGHDYDNINGVSNDYLIRAICDVLPQVPTNAPTKTIKTDLYEKEKEKETNENFKQEKIKINLYQFILGKVLGCSHAITDVSLPLGNQTLGRALFWHHSFYNHVCAPNAFLSCYIMTKNTNTRTSTKIDFDTDTKSKTMRGKEMTTLKKRTSSRHDKSDHPQLFDDSRNYDMNTDHYCDDRPYNLTATVHALQDIPVGESINLSYIPLSGLTSRERQERLLTNYGFECSCIDCENNCIFMEEGDETIENNKRNSGKMPTLLCTDDIDAIREVQYSCHNELLQLQRQLEAQEEKQSKNNKLRNACSDTSNDNHDHDDEMAGKEETKSNGDDKEHIGSIYHVIGLIEMTQRGIRNQAIPSIHEVSLESYRLLAKAYGLLSLYCSDNDNNHNNNHDLEKNNNDEKEEHADDDGDGDGDNDGSTATINCCIKCHKLFFQNVSKLLLTSSNRRRYLFDPVALATQHLEYSRILSLLLKKNEQQQQGKAHSTRKEGEQNLSESFSSSTFEYNKALDLLMVSLGKGHPWVKSLMEAEST